MRCALLSCALLLLVPVASAEEWGLYAGGLTLARDEGVLGAQVGEESGAGLRYWSNATEGGSSALVVTTCYTPGSHAVTYCERHWLQA